MTRNRRRTLPAGSGPKIAASVRAAVACEPGLCAVGAFGVALAGVCVVAVAVRGRSIAPEGKMLDAATFCFGVGVFTLTVALLLPLVGYSPAARRLWRRTYYVFAVYGLMLESLQAFRGLDPRFTEAGGPLDVIAGIVFGVTAASNTVAFVVLGLRFFRSDVLADRPTLRAGIRYGAISVALSFAVGIVMSVNSGRHIGEDGNLLLSHGLGVHGLEVIPLVALVVSRAETSPPATRWLHAAGVGWLAACVAALAQALLGDPPLQPSAATALVVAGLSLWAAGASHTLLTWRRTAQPLQELQGAILRREPGLHASRLGLDGGPRVDDLERAAALTPTEVRRTMPTGTVTFLFSDIEGSSALWEQAGTEMAVALARHDEIVRAAFNRHGGWIFFVGGDGFGVAFARAADALASAIDAQRDLQRAAWPRPIELQVRVGMHMGEADERDGTYFGHPVNVAARLMAAAAGGQIVVSDVTAAAIGDVMGAELIDLGRQRLRGLVDPVGASCVRAEGLAWVEPSLIDRDVVVGTLPRPVT